MKNIFKISLTICFIWIVNMSFTSESKVWDKPVNDYIVTEKLNFDNCLIVLKRNVSQFTITEIKETYLKLRLSFKKLEPFWEYSDPNGVKEFINGAPLPKIEKKAPSLVIKEPQGLQVLDELIYDDSLDKQIVLEQIDKLISFTKNQQIRTEYSIRELIEICREQLVRLFSLGLTGFDTPGSKAAILDAKATVLTLDFIHNQLLIALVNPKVTPFINANLSLLNKCSTVLSQSTDFNTLNRLEITTNNINPLFNNLAIIQATSEIELYEETNGLPKPINYSNKNIFSADFLNAEAYTVIPKGMLTDSLIELGKLLFNDKNLSKSKAMSCATCHNSKLAYTDGKTTSIPNTNKVKHNRNAPSLSYAIYAKRFFWDLRAHNIENQIEHVFYNPKEFNSSVHEISGIIENTEIYANKFKAIFGKWYSQSVNKITIGYAFSAYVKSLPKHNSTFDLYMQQKTNKIDKSVMNGFNLFMGKAQCGICHFAPVFAGLVPPNFEESETEVIGVPEKYGVKNPTLDLDEGRFNSTLKDNAPFMKYAFKTPSIRNVALTAPYMHNGSFKTLEQVMEFYNNGGGHGLGFKLDNQTLSPDKLDLTKTEINDVIAFMKSLTDL